MTKLYGHVLNAALRRRLATDPDVIELKTPQEMKNYKKRARAQIMQQLIETAAKEREILTTVNDHQERLIGLEDVTEFVRAIEDPTHVLSTVNIPPSINLDEDFEEEQGSSNRFEEAEPDVEDQATTNEQAVPSCMYENDDQAPSESVSCLAATQSFMEILLYNQFSQAQEGRAGTFEPQNCLICLEDETVPDKHRQKVWRNKSHLQKNMTADFHSEHRKFCRKAEKIAFSDKQHMYRCPYCAEIFRDDQPGYPSLRSLRYHIIESTDKIFTSTNTSRLDPTPAQIHEHDMLKTQAGWYCAWFLGDPGTAQQRDKEAGKRKLLAIGRVYSNACELQAPIPHAFRMGVQHGRPVSWAQEAYHRTISDDLTYDGNLQAMQLQQRQSQQAGLLTDDYTPMIQAWEKGKRGRGTISHMPPDGNLAQVMPTAKRLKRLHVPSAGRG